MLSSPFLAKIIAPQLANKMNKSAYTLWFTGLSGAGKTTISERVSQELKQRGHLVELLDGDIIRKHLTRGLGFSKTDRDENIHRIGFVAHLLCRNGVYVLVAAISPYAESRQKIKNLIGDQFIEIYVNSPIEICEARDVKGLYKKARSGEIKNFTGIDDPYEPPSHPDLECRTDLETIEESVAKVLNLLALKNQ